MARWSWLAAWLCLGLWGCSGGDDDAHNSASPTAGSGGSEGGGHAGSGNAGSTRAGASGSDATGGNGGSAISGGSGAFDPGDRCGPVVSMPRCIAGGWCWEAPLPFGGNLDAIDGPADGSSLFAVGAQGSAFRLCEGHWVPIETGVDVELTGVWHPSADLAVAVGAAGTVLRWDGHGWTKLQAPTDRQLRAVWGLSPDQIWIGGAYDEQGPLMFELHGNELTRAQLPKPFLNGNEINAIGGRAPQLFVGGGSLGVFDSWYFDGTQWSYNQTSVDGIARELRSYADGTTLALVPGINEDVVYRWNGPGTEADKGWQAGYGRDMPIRLVSLFTDVDGRPAVVEDARDIALPGKSASFDGTKWNASEERFTALPNAIWNGDHGGFAVGDATTLLERGKNAIWTQRDDVSAISGKPILLGGASEQALVLVTEHEIDRRGSHGWQLVAREDDVLYVKAAVDDQGRVYVVEQSQLTGEWDTLKYHDDDGWHELPQIANVYELFANAPDDVWIGNGSNNVQHFDGSSWTDASELCDVGVSEPVRFRRAPDGKIWVLTNNGVVEIDLAGHECNAYIGSGTLQDVVWTDSGKVWAISTWGELFQLTGASWAMSADLIPEGTSEYVHELFAGPGSTLRVAIHSENDFDAAFKLITVDVAAAPVAREPTQLPGPGRFWASGDVLYEAVSGGVLRREGG